MSDEHLPILKLVPDLLTQLRAQSVLALQAPPGAGKSTELPIHLLPDFASANGRIILLQPRRLAVRSVAHRLADRLGEKPGERIGYRMRGESRVSAKTLLEVQTEGVFLRLLQNDPALESVSLVIFDEYHERSLDADLSFALCRHSQLLFDELRETPLRLLLMSATLDNEGLKAALPDMPWLISEGRQFPVTVHYEQKSSDPSRHQSCDLDLVHSRVLAALTQHDGNILVFLPGQAEIRKLQSALEASLDDPHIQCRPLYGALKMEAQQAAIQAPPAGQRKVVLATDIAETSLTIEGIHCVIDTGVAKKPVFVARTGLSRLDLQAIPRSAADQRAGRAGRLGPGVAYRLWTEEQHQRRARHRKPDILSSDLSGPLLQCIAFGCDDPFELPWVEPPPQAAIEQAFDLLLQLGFIVKGADSSQLTDKGQAALKLPLEPRLQALLIASVEGGCSTLGCELALCLEETPRRNTQSIDIIERLADTRQALAGRSDRRLLREYKRLNAICAELKPECSTVPVPENFQVAYLCMAAFPDRLAWGRTNNEYLMVNGRGVRLPASAHQGYAHSAASWIVVIDTRSRKEDSRDLVVCASAVPKALLDSQWGPDIATQRVELSFNAAEKRFQARDVTRMGAIELKSQPIALPPLADAGELIVVTLRDTGLAFFDQWPRLNAWLNRLTLLRQLEAEALTQNPWPDWSETSLLASLEDWLLPMLPAVQGWGALCALDLRTPLEARLEWSLLQRLKQEAPERYQAPSGIWHSIDYEERPPVVELKLQELFSLTETPAIARGRQKLKLHLLSPAGRSLAVTSDLASFWREAYPQVKAEMKGRYPKHPWPEDPISAEPTVLTKRALAGEPKR